MLKDIKCTELFKTLSDRKMKNNNPYINRREFLKITGVATAASTVALTGCTSDNNNSADALGEVPKGLMTYRNFPSLGDTVSLLGYGCMRWPTIPNPEGRGEIIDQEAVNGLVDYAIEHGVNYFDTAPPYVQGLSEEATGIALKRHPRDKYFIATKLSNHRIGPDFDASVAMYKNSFDLLHVDYIDYYLLHNIGTVGSSGFDVRFIENGLLDFLLKEREAGRIRHLGWSFHGIVEQFDYILSYHEKVHWDFVQIQMNYTDWKYATEGRNVNAEYLYEELWKRNIPSVIMEPLLDRKSTRLNSSH